MGSSSHALAFEGGELPCNVCEVSGEVYARAVAGERTDAGETCPECVD